MDLELIKQKLNDYQNKNVKKEKVDYTKIMWKPKAGRYQIRIVPSKFDKSNPFREVYYHYGISKFPMLALNNWDEKDPIIEFVNKLRKSSEKEDWVMAGKLSPKIRIFANVIVRGEEEKGVRLWEFGKTMHQMLLASADDPDYGDYTDVVEGRDITVDVVDDVVGGRKATKSTIRIKPKSSPLTEDKALLESWLNNQTDILAVNRKYSFDEIKKALQDFISPPDSDNDSEPVTEDNHYSESTLKEVPEPVASDKFDELFDEKQ